MNRHNRWQTLSVSRRAPRGIALAVGSVVLTRATSIAAPTALAFAPHAGFLVNRSRERSSPWNEEAVRGV